MVLDQVENFVRVTVSGSHASGDSTISLQSGEASNLPDPNNGKYNLVWFDSENYQLPDKDPNVEIVRVNSVDTTNDTVSVTRGQENTTATTKSETGAEYELLLGPTAKTIQEIDQFKLDSSAYSPEADTHARYSDGEAVDAVNSTTDTLTAPLYSHKTDISSSVTIPSGFATVVSPPLTGSSSISGGGRIVSSGGGSSGGDASTLSGNTPEELSGVISTFVATGVNESDINDGRTIDWSTETTNTGSYSFDGRTITIPSNGVYEIRSDIDFESTGQSRANPNIFIRKNGSIIGVGGRSGYMRDAEGHNHSSIHASFIGSLLSGDSIDVDTSRDADGGTVSPERGHVYIKQIE